MKSVVYIIPGFFEYPDNYGYVEISKMFKARGFEVVIIRVDWESKDKIFYGFVNDFIEYYKKNNIYDNVYVLGFSAGAWISFMASLVIKPKCVILCSLSPFFNEDMLDWKEKWITPIGYKKFETIKNYIFANFVKLIDYRIILLYGEYDNEVVKNRSIMANKLLKNSKLVFIRKAEHDIRQAEYLESIKKIISEENL